jgi:Holliday junction DNA helicase RuvA
MIGRLEGQLHHLSPGEVVVDAGGVGYLVATTLRAYQALAGAARAVLWVHTQVRDDAIVLYGFPERAELVAFERLIAVAGVGPRTALAVLSALSPDDLAAAVEGGNSGLLQRAPGVGKKTADRIVLELRGRLGAAPQPAGTAEGDAVSALVNLGYNERDALRAVQKILAERRDAGLGGDLGEVLRLALRSLTR